MKGCTFCSSTNIVKGKKYKCLDCNKSFSNPKEVKDRFLPMREDDYKRIETIRRKATRPKLGWILRH